MHGGRNVSWLCVTRVASQVLHALCGTVFVGADAGQRSQPAYDEDFSGKVLPFANYSHTAMHLKYKNAQ